MRNTWCYEKTTEEKKEVNYVKGGAVLFRFTILANQLIFAAKLKIKHNDQQNIYHDQA